LVLVNILGLFKTHNLNSLSSLPFATAANKTTDMLRPTMRLLPLPGPVDEVHPLEATSRPAAHNHPEPLRIAQTLTAHRFQMCHHLIEKNTLTMF
jgi:hypothetical protein